MANPYQARASVNAWLAANIVLASNCDPADRLVFQGIQGQQPTEWHVSWDAEQDGDADQHYSRLVQIVRARGDGDENAFEIETATLMTALGLDKPGRHATIPVYDYPDNPTTAIGHCIIRRQGGKGWVVLPDPAGRPEAIRAALTLQVDYGP